MMNRGNLDNLDGKDCRAAIEIVQWVKGMEHDTFGDAGLRQVPSREWADLQVLAEQSLSDARVREALHSCLFPKMTAPVPEPEPEAVEAPKPWRLADYIEARYREKEAEATT
jgi:hypothetical protein